MVGVIFEFEGTTIEKDQHACDLVSWLSQEEDLRGMAQVRMAGPGRGEQGGAADAALVLAAVAPLASSFFLWLTERAKSGRIRVRITISDHAGKSLDLDVAGPVDVEPLLGQITEHLDQHRQG